MQEKDIKEKLNQELEEMAPDMLKNILRTPIEPVKNEKELLGNGKPLFKKERTWKSYYKVPVTALIAACIAVLVLLVAPTLYNNNDSKKVAFSVIIDVNPSIRISVNHDGTIHNVKAINNDGKEIAAYVNSELQDEDKYTRAVDLTVKNLRKEGYLKKKKNAMLISVVDTNNQDLKEQMSEIKVGTNTALSTRNIKCRAVYQEVDVSAKVARVAKKNNVSEGKASLCIKLAKEDKATVKEMCNENIDKLANRVEHSKNPVVDSIAIVKDNNIQMEDFSETESMAEITETESYAEETPTDETESVAEIESISVNETEDANQPTNETTDLTNNQ